MPSTLAIRNAVRRNRRSVILAGCKRKLGASVDECAQAAECCEKVAFEIIAELVRDRIVMLDRRIGRFVLVPTVAKQEAKPEPKLVCAV